MSSRLRAWLSEELNTRGLSQGELARRCNISQSLISRTLSGDISPSADFCIKVAEALGVSPEYLLRLAEILPPESAVSEDATLQELIEVAKNLSPENRQELLDYARFKYQQQKPN